MAGTTGKTGGKRPDPEQQQHTITLPSGTVAYLLKTSTRARRMRLSVRPGRGLEVTTPRGVRLAAVEAVLSEKAAWIESALRSVAEREQAAGIALHDGTLLPCYGETLRLVLAPASTGTRGTVRLRGDALEVTLPAGPAGAMGDAGGEAALLRALAEAWYRRQARAVFAARVAHWAAQFGVTYGRIAIKDQKSRWGSCSRTGNLNFNWRLLLAPASVLEYIVIHELAHRKEPNHSPRFWAEVAAHCPHYKQERRWLQLSGDTLRFSSSDA